MKRTPLLLLSILVLAACETTSPGPGPTDGAAECPSRAPCPSCGPGEDCLAPNVYFSVPAATCLRTCSAANPCAAGLRCVALFGVQKTLCISDDVPRACKPLPAGAHCDLPGPSCKDASTLLRPVPILQNGLCGTEIVVCPNGCQGADGAASCR